MSLINDALKRATQTPGASKPAAEMETTMKPAPQPRTVGLPVYFMPVLLFIISGACLFLVKGWDARRQNAASTQPVIVQARALHDVPSGEGGELPVPENRQFALNDAPTPSVPPTTTATAAAVTPAESAPASAMPDTAQAPTFRLQGIFYRPAKPSAVVNSKTVFIGDRIANAKVTAIDHQSVTLDLADEIKVLTLP